MQSQEEKLTKFYAVRIGETLKLAVEGLPLAKRQDLAEKVRKLLRERAKCPDNQST